jgi:hypothetical protein
VSSAEFSARPRRIARALRASEKRFRLFVSGMPLINDPGRLVGYRGVARDITD